MITKAIMGSNDSGHRLGPGGYQQDRVREQVSKVHNRLIIASLIPLLIDKSMG